MRHLKTKNQKGFKAKGSLPGSTYDFTRTKNYIDIPLLVAVKPIEFLTLVAGPQYSYLLKQKYDFENASTSIEQEEEFINDNIRKNTLAFSSQLRTCEICNLFPGLCNTSHYKDAHL